MIGRRHRIGFERQLKLKLYLWFEVLQLFCNCNPTIKWQMDSSTDKPPYTPQFKQIQPARDPGDYRPSLKNIIVGTLQEPSSLESSSIARAAVSSSVEASRDGVSYQWSDGCF
ncbi:unnamed protein product [Cuscuta epithymum]|uniref:Uncharacterized protein n=1 Tax=Cuscuta epithymum TaxID=186058 RepID=A0AAV0DIQ6_9ASTE|nr:unnamed protein product [Cuscuta epithymum]